MPSEKEFSAEETNEIQYLGAKPNGNLPDDARQQVEEAEAKIDDIHRRDVGAQPEIINSKFDINQAFLDQGITEEVNVKRVVLNIPIAKPSKTKFFRAHPEYSQNVVIFKDEEDYGKFYLVGQALQRQYIDDGYGRVVTLSYCVYKSGESFLWPLTRLEGVRDNEWAVSAWRALDLAKQNWIKLVTVRGARGYEAHQPLSANYGEPIWLEMEWSQILELAFRDRIIFDETHQVHRTLYGIN